MIRQVADLGGVEYYSSVDSDGWPTRPGDKLVDLGTCRRGKNLPRGSKLELFSSAASQATLLWQTQDGCR